MTLVVPFETDLVSDAVEVVRDDPWDDRRMRQRVQRLRRGRLAVAARRDDAPARALGHARGLRPLRARGRSKPLAQWEHAPPSKALDAEARVALLKLRAALSCGDAFVCASERQRDLWLGALLAARPDRPRALRATTPRCGA